MAVVIVVPLVVCCQYERHDTGKRRLKLQHQCGAIVGSVCTGSVLLAEAGVLDNREATSHWSAVPVFQRFYPKV